jgi:lipopolysaccharide export LptBFGC system permease protein LptF
MRRLSDRYVFGEMILPFLIGTLAVLMMLVGNTLFAILPDMLQKKWPVGVVARVCVLNIPVVLVLTLPVSTALAASLATNRMARDNEFTVMRAAGMPLLRAFLPMFAFGLMMSAADLYVANRVVPWAWKEQQNVEQFLENLPENPVELGRSFTAENFTISFETAQKLTPTKRRLNKVVIVSNPTAYSGEYAEITTAETADYENGTWKMRNVVHHRFDKQGFTIYDAASPDATLSLRIDFSNLYQPAMGGQATNFSFEELTDRAMMARRLGNFREATNYEVERWFKLSLPAMCLVLAVCSPPLGLRFSRTGAFTGVLLSIITVFIAWNTLLLFKIIGLGGYLPAPVAAWVTNVLFLALGLWLFKTQE